MKIKRFIWWWGPVIVWAGMIFVLSSIPDLKVSEGPSDFLLRKTAHMLVFAGMFLWCYRALRRNWFADWQTKAAVLAAMIAVAYGVSDELHQTLVPTRTGKVIDVGIDAIGIAVAVLGLYIWTYWNRVLKEVNEGSKR